MYIYFWKLKKINIWCFQYYNFSINILVLQL